MFTTIILVSLCALGLFLLMQMADGANYAKAVSPTPATFMGAEWDGRVIAEHDSYTFAAAAIGATVNVGVLKPGEVFLFGFVTLGATLGASTTLALGDAGSATRYMAAVASTAAGILWAADQAGVGYKNETQADIPILVTLGGGEATGAIEVVIVKARQ
jgi:hypothetical protein